MAMEEGAGTGVQDGVGTDTQDGDGVGPASPLGLGPHSGDGAILMRLMPTAIIPMPMGQLLMRRRGSMRDAW